MKKRLADKGLFLLAGIFFMFLFLLSGVFAATTTPGCSGTPTSCINSFVSSADNDYDGPTCSVAGCVLTNLRTACTGTPTPCSSFSSSISCSGQPGCVWTAQDVNGLCSTTTADICTTGTSTSGTDTETNDVWSCAGLNGGTTMPCSLPKPIYYSYLGTVTGHPTDHSKCSFDNDPKHTLSYAGGNVNNLVPTESENTICYDYWHSDLSGDKSLKYIVISTTAPVAVLPSPTFTTSGPLSFGSSIGEKIRFWEDSTGYPTIQYGIGIRGSEFAFYKDPVAKYAFYDGNFNANDPVMTIDKDGNVGIGTENPTGRLTLKGIVEPQQGLLTFFSGTADMEYDGGSDKVFIFRDTNTAGGKTIFQGGDVGIGKNPTYKLDVAGAVGATDFLYTSDIRLKENIKPLEGSLGKILELQGVSFDWKESGEPNIGLIAQDVEKVYPELVSTSADGIKSVKYGNLVAPLIESAKEQNKRIDNQQKEIDELKKEIERLKYDKRWL